MTTDRPLPADRDRTGFDRRTLLRGVAATGALGASGSLLAACGGDSGAALGSADQIPVGGGMVFAEQKIVVTQPRRGVFVGLSAVCTHQGCTVGDVSGGTINCPCHGSKFNLDGTVANGPASQPLPKKQIEVQGGEIGLA